FLAPRRRDPEVADLEAERRVVPTPGPEASCGGWSLGRSLSIDQLLERWRSLEDPGATTTLETLCSHQPQEVEDVKQKLSAVAAMLAFLGLPPGTAAAGVRGPDGAKDTEGPDTNAERAADVDDAG